MRWDNLSLTNMYHKDSAVREILGRQPEGTDFYVSYITNPGWSWGFKYFFTLYGRESLTGSAKEPVYTIVVPKELARESIDLYWGSVGLILSEEITGGKHPYRD